MDALETSEIPLATTKDLQIDNEEADYFDIKTNEE